MGIRNSVLHLKGPIDLRASTLNIHARLKECTRVFGTVEVPSYGKITAKWAPPQLGAIKLNVDAAISHTSVALAVIARNGQGVMIKVWSKIIPKTSPLLAEAEAILWALYLAKGELWRHIIVESNSKLSVDAILDQSDSPLWPIPTLVFNICLVAKSFLSCLFL